MLNGGTHCMEVRVADMFYVPRLYVLLLCFLVESPATAVAENESNSAPGASSTMDYYVAFGNTLTRITPSLQLSISAVESFPVSFQINTLLGFSYQGTVLPNKTTNVTIPSSFELSKQRDSNSIKGIQVRSTNGRVGLIGYSYDPISTDGFLALPCTSLDLDTYEYYSMTYNDQKYPSFIIVVGCEDSTVVNYWNLTTGLNRMETLYFEDLFDYTGHRITSNKPVSVFSGHTCSQIPNDRGWCDHLVEQVPPTALWGTHFLTSSYFTRTSGEVYRFITATNSTNVTISCNTSPQSEVLSVSAGGWKEFWRDRGSLCSIESNNPLLVMEYSRGRTTDGVSDPFMMMVPSVDQYTNGYVFESPTNLSNYITILVTPQYYQPEQILVDGVSQENANWAPVHCANGSVCGYRAYVTLEPGDHHVWHSVSCAKISVLMYGFEYNHSYGQPAGHGILYGTGEDTRSEFSVSHTVLEGDPHSVRFTVNLPPGQGQMITQYSINCTSESSGGGRTASGTGLESVTLTFDPATYYLCSTSMSTVCGVMPNFDTIELLTVPAAVEGLTVNASDDKLLIHWNNSVGVVSHYSVIVTVDGRTMQRNVSEEELKFQSEELSEYHTIKVEVMAVNDAGSGPSATATITSQQPTNDDVIDDIGTEPSATDSKQINGNTSQSSSAPALIGGSVSAVLVFIFVVISIVVITVMWRRKQNSYIQQQHHTKTHKHGSHLAVHVEGDTELHIYEMPSLYPDEPELTSCEVYNHGSTINCVRQTAPTTSSMIDNHDSVIYPVEQEIPTTLSVIHDYDYPGNPEIPTVSSVAYGHNSASEPVRQDIPTTLCEAYNHVSATNPLRQDVSTTPCTTYDHQPDDNPAREEIPTATCVAYETSGEN